MKWSTFFSALVLGVVLVLGSSFNYKWGFFGHRRINRMAVFTLPPEMIGFFKKNIEYLTEHAVDPDKRRYATRHEAVRHYIDIDHWGRYPFAAVPRDWAEALAKHSGILIIDQQGDTIRLTRDTLGTEVRRGTEFIRLRNPKKGVSYAVASAHYLEFFKANVLPQYYEDEWTVSCDSLRQLFSLPPSRFDCQDAFAFEGFSEYGILPYHLLQMQRRLTRAFQQRNADRLLQIAAEMGHYVADAHVPLHTTENYNGQLTNQIGIHAFWESRLPELYADKDYDFFVGKAIYIENPKAYFWDVVLTSHQLVDSVLAIEKELSLSFPQDRQYCFEERLDQTVRTQCQEYAAAFHQRLAGMVEDRMQDAVLAVGSVWFTAWVDAGQPDLKFLDRFNDSDQQKAEAEKLEAQFRSGEIKGRKHE